MDKLSSGLITVFTALIGVAIIATLVSRNANTANVVTSVAQGFAGDLSSAIAPVTGGQGFNWQGFSGGTPQESIYG